MAEEKIEKILCPTCGVNTKHKSMWESGNQRWEDEESGIWEDTSYCLLQCMGCETPTLRKEYMFSEDTNMVQVDGEWIAMPEYTFWPKTSHRMIKLKYISNAPPTVKRIYRETIEAYNGELPTLCAAGIRALIEAVCKEKGIAGSDLKDKIEDLKNKHIIPSDFAEALHENRLLGNDALHEATLFGDAELKTAIELIETFIDMVYETQGKKEILKALRTSKKS